MPGGFNPEEAATRGRRDPELASLLDAEQLGDDETEGVHEPEEYLLLDGDALMSKITLGPDVTGYDAWVTFGAQTRVMKGEKEEQAFDRLASLTVNRVIDESRALEAAILEERAIRAEEMRQHRISRQQQ